MRCVWLGRSVIKLIKNWEGYGHGREGKKVAHPYIPNSVPEIKEELLKEIGSKVWKIFSVKSLNICGLEDRFNIPKAILSEYELKKHVTELLSKNKNCGGIQKLPRR